MDVFFLSVDEYRFSCLVVLDVSDVMYDWVMRCVNNVLGLVFIVWMVLVWM